ncbi:MAG: DUF2867 domain-containing protein [Paludibacter sp.]|nr:DUF2867 domain-containing protein [Paludibacter sp.]
MKIVKTKIPESSLLYPDRNHYHYIDSYEGAVKDKNNMIGIDDVAKAFLKPGSKWVGTLMTLRNKIVSLFGLKTPNNKMDADRPANFKFEVGERVGIFRIFSRTTNELVMGEDDKHLNFRVSLLLETPENDSSTKTITVTTLVIYNNRFGRLYFFPVKPFHKLIVRSGLKISLHELEMNAQKG